MEAAIPKSTQFQPFPDAQRAPETGQAANLVFLTKADIQQSTPFRTWALGWTVIFAVPLKVAVEKGKQQGLLSVPAKAVVR